MKKLLITTLLCLFMLGVTSTAKAVLISGTTFYTGISGFSATVGWEVYAPGEPTSWLAPSAFYDYFYIVTNTSSLPILPTPPISNDIWSFSIGNPTGAPITSAGSLPIGGVAPTWIIPGPGVSYLFLLPAIAPGGFSDRLFLTSTYPPGPVPGGLLALGGASDTQSLPGPTIPEPGSMMLLGMGILGLFGLRKRA